MINRYGLNPAFRSPKVRSDYREPSTGASEGRRFGDLESRIFLLVIILGIGMTIYSVVWPHNALS